MTNSQLEFGDTIRLIKARTRESNAALAEVLGLTTSAFSSRVRGETEWKLSEVEVLASHWRVEPADLVMGPAHAIRTVTSEYEVTPGHSGAELFPAIERDA